MKHYVTTACLMVVIEAETEEEAKQIVESNIRNCLRPHYLATTALEIAGKEGGVNHETAETF